MPQLSIYINAELQKRMGSTPKSVNWSKLASNAFEKKLSDIAQAKKEKDMQVAIQRLRASRAQHEETTYDQGYEAGQKWAESSAEFRQLKRLRDFVEAQHFDNFFVEDSSAPFSSGERLAFIIEGEDPDRGVSNDFWDSIDSDERYDSDYSKGFAEGASDFFDEVESKL